MRKVVLDVETTGLHPQQGDRIVEIGCVEIKEDGSLGAEWQAYLNPERSIGAEAEQIHGISDALVADQPKFREVAEELLTFLGDAQIIAHNAEFDRGFLNAELAKIDKTKLLPQQRWLDSILLARRKFPSGRVDLDSLCDKLRIAKQREKHGALLDAKLLALVFQKLCPWRDQFSLPADYQLFSGTPLKPLIVIQPSAAEQRQHQVFVAKIKNSLWSS